jgi:hypothetical protein
MCSLQGGIRGAKGRGASSAYQHPVGGEHGRRRPGTGDCRRSAGELERLRSRTTGKRKGGGGHGLGLRVPRSKKGARARQGCPWRPHRGPEGRV